MANRSACQAVPLRWMESGLQCTAKWLGPGVPHSPATAACRVPATTGRHRAIPFAHADLRVRMSLVRAPVRGARLAPRDTRRLPAVHLRRRLPAALDLRGAHGWRRPARAARVRGRRRLLRRRLRLPSLTSDLTPDLAGEWADCARCALSASRSVVVAGEGPMPAELMLVADAPGFH